VNKSRQLAYLSLQTVFISSCWYIYTKEHYLAIENEMVTFVATWMELEDIMLSEMSQAKGDKHCMYLFIFGS
jgi:hypothetical protein